jgi:drug/metabolite transporter (DMT)-like permease
MLGALAFFSCSDAASKYLTRSLPSIEVTWLRYFIFATTIFLVAVVTRQRGVLRARQPVLQIWRGLGVLGSALLFITGLSFLPMAEATSISFVAPLFVTALAIPLLGEKVGVRRWAAVIIGLIGAIIVVRPGTSALGPAAVLPFLSAISWALALVITRKAGGADRPITALAYSAIVGLAVTTALVPFVWVTPGWSELLLGAVTGLASAVAQWLIVLAFRTAKASVLAPFSYSQLISSAGFGFFIFGDIPDLWTIAGAVVIIASGIYTAHRETVRARPGTSDMS